MKTCSLCGVAYGRSMFRKSKGATDGLRSECRPCERQRTKEHHRIPSVKRRIREHEQSPSARRNQHHSRIKGRYGICKETYLELIGSSGGCCAICGNGFVKNEPVIDHDHVTLAYRGLLCAACNALLSNAKDVPSTLRRAAEYLEDHVAGACEKAPLGWDIERVGIQQEKRAVHERTRKDIVRRVR